MSLKSYSRYRTWTVAAVAVVGAVVLSKPALAVVGCQPKVPCPCAADGTCSPQGPWGHTQTKWRPWPGDDISIKSETPEEQKRTEELTLPGSEPPPPEKEGLRGSKTPESRRKRARDGEEAPAGDLFQGQNPGLVAPLPEAGPAEPAAQPPAFQQPEADGLQIPDQFDVEEPLQDAPVPEAEPEEAFDPFGVIDSGTQAPRTATRPISQPSGKSSTGPPALPASLLKVSGLNTPRNDQRKVARHATRKLGQPRILASR